MTTPGDTSTTTTPAAPRIARAVLGLLRATLVAVALAVFGFGVIAASPIRVRIREATPSAWLTCAACRLGVAILGISVDGHRHDAIGRHDGLVFANHISWTDIIVLLSIAPVRFLSAVEIRRLPIIGAVAAAIGTVFVDRSDDDSRAKAREQVAAARKLPPLVIFPEGGVPDEHVLWPFRYGAFELATAGSIPILPVALVYDRPADVRWGTEKLPASIWRALCDVATNRVHVDVFEPIETRPEDDAVALAVEVHRKFAARLDLPEAM